MGLNVYLENEKGHALEEIADSKNLLHRLLPSIEDTSFQCLRFIDWYGDTVFNRLQMGVFLEEIKRITKNSTTPEDTALLIGIEALAKRCQNEVHLYLKFYGD